MSVSIQAAGARAAGELVSALALYSEVVSAGCREHGKECRELVGCTPAKGLAS